MAGATVVTAVIGDFTGSFTSLASSFGDNFIIPSSPQPLSGGAERRRGQAVSPSSVLLPQPRTCQQPPETSPRRGDCEARRLMDLHLGAAPPRQPRTR
ncbi:unnamed protein product [Rangifer tarandus platyrhynchus]|uniref:Uncharacterized protein n=2 Tax=Rangifer tarandus platyrhynchus TaxID=3082113 RepID=A0ABN8YW22_RANTA|nr:unnamed protein product [Rangifer tarandus platyrhynchus]CAI9703009.1 unnamed protein product [Rangifer tarandus platyrhynchus]